MKSSHMHRIRVAAVAGMALAAVHQVGLAAGDAGEEARIAEFAPALRKTNALALPAANDRAAPLTLFIEGPGGNAFRLVHVRGEGWRYGSGTHDTDRPDARLQTTASLTMTSSQAVDTPPPADEPLTVFIDGPSGFTYVWLRDSGWKFVGRLSGSNP